jgi:hypothetical protein
MPYHEYLVHFKPTAVCAACGRRVHLRHFPWVLLGFVAVAAAFVVLVVLTDSRPLVVAGVALAVVVALLADFWTYRNLSWDPDPVPQSSAPPPP